MNRAIENGDPAAERIPDDRGAVTELFQLAPKDEMARFTNVNQSRANLVIRTGAVGSASVRELVARLQALLREVLPAGIRGETTGNAILLARSADGIAGGQLQAVAAAATVIFVLVALALRSWKLGVIAMIPNLLPVAMFFATAGARGRAALAADQPDRLASHSASRSTTPSTSWSATGASAARASRRRRQRASLACGSDCRSQRPP